MFRERRFADRRAEFALFVAIGVAGVAINTALVWLFVVAFFVPGPHASAPQGLRAAWPAVRDRQVSTGMWLTMLAGLAFGVLDVLAPLRLSHLGATATVIGMVAVLIFMLVYYRGAGINADLALIMNLIIGFGICFQLPVALTLLACSASLGPWGVQAVALARDGFALSPASTITSASSRS